MYGVGHSFNAQDLRQIQVSKYPPYAHLFLSHIPILLSSSQDRLRRVTSKKGGRCQSDELMRPHHGSLAMKEAYEVHETPTNPRYMHYRREKDCENKLVQDRKIPCGCIGV